MKKVISIILTLLMVMSVAPLATLAGPAHELTDATYTIAYDANGGEGMMPETTGTEPMVSANTFTREGYVFTAWNTASDGTGDTYVAGNVLAENATLYAQWQGNGDGQQTPQYGISGVMENVEGSVAVRYMANGGTGTMTASSDGTVAACGFVRTGYAFASWNTKASGRGTSYAPGAVVTSDVTLYAIWTGNACTVSYSDNGAGVSVPSTAQYTYTVGGYTTVAASEPSYAGHAFRCWNTAADGSGTVYMANDAIAMAPNGITLYAIWAENTASTGDVAYIGSTGYATLKAAFAAVPTNGTQTTVTIARDFSETSIANVKSGQNIVLNMGGYRYDNATASAPILVSNGGRLAITGIKSLAQIEGGRIAGVRVSAGGTLTSIENVTITAPTYPLYNYGGTVTSINNVTTYATASSSGIGLYNNGSITTIANTKFVGGYAAIDNRDNGITGGSSIGEINNCICSANTIGIRNGVLATIGAISGGYCLLNDSPSNYSWGAAIMNTQGEIGEISGLTVTSQASECNAIHNNAESHIAEINNVTAVATTNNGVCGLYNGGTIGNGTTTGITGGTFIGNMGIDCSADARILTDVPTIVNGVTVLANGEIAFLIENGAAVKLDSVSVYASGNYGIINRSIITTANNVYATAHMTAMYNAGTIDAISGSTFEAATRGLHNIRSITLISSSVIRGAAALYNAGTSTRDAVITEMTNNTIEGKNNGIDNRSRGYIGDVTGGSVVGGKYAVYNYAGWMNTVSGNVGDESTTTAAIYNTGSINTVDCIANVPNAAYGVYNTNYISIVSATATITSNNYGIFNSSSATVERIAGSIIAQKYGVDNRGKINSVLATITNAERGIFNRGTIKVLNATISNASIAAVANYNKIEAIPGGSYAGTSFAFYNNNGTVESLYGGSFKANGRVRAIYTTGSSSISYIYDEVEHVLSKTADDNGFFTVAPKVAEPTYSVTYNAGTDDATVAGIPTDTTLYEVGMEVTIPSTTPTRTNYTFNKWIDVNGTEYAPGATIAMPTGGIVLTATWTIDSYAITYVANIDGIVNNMPENTTCNVGELFVISANIPTREGYTFTGWQNGTDIHRPGATLVMPAGAVQLTAQWTVNTYTVTYIAGASGVTNLPTPYVENCDYNTTFTVSATIPVRTGYTFIGWTATGSVSGDYQANETFVIGAGNVILTASWQANAHTVTFVGGATGVTNLPDAIDTTFGSTVAIPDTTPERAGYTFTGWTDGTNEYFVGDSFMMGDADVTLTATWDAESFNVTYAEGAIDATIDNMPTADICACDAVYTIPDMIPTRTGYTFAGWSYGGQTYAADGTATFTMPNNDVVLTATWQIKSYNVTYTANAADVEVPAQTSENFGATVTVSSMVPERTGYTFAGWSTTMDTEIIMPNATFTMPAEAVTLTAVWTANTYNVKYYGLGADAESMPADGTVAFNSEYTIPSTIPTRSGYTFAGWTATAGVEGTFDAGDTFTLTTASDVELWAEWTVETYTVTFDANGGEFAEAATQKTSEVTYAKQYGEGTFNAWTTQPTRTGYTFNGWNSAADGTGTLYTATTVVADLGTGITLYAMWTVNGYNVSYVAGAEGVTGMPEDTTANFGSEVAMPESDPTRTGYNFTGWTVVDAEGNEITPVNDAFTMPAANVTITATWSINSYAVAFNANAENVTGMPENTTAQFNATVTLPTTNPTRTGYDFAGWTVKDADNETVTVTDGTFTMPAKNVTVTANWTATVYEITYNLVDGTAYNRTTYTIETETFTLSNPTKTGYTFTGWTETGVEGTSMEVVIAQGSTGNKEFTANWTANTYTVAFNANGGTINGGLTAQNSVVTFGETFGAGTFNGWTTEPVRTGYTFVNWNTMANGEGTTALATDTVGVLAEGYTLYAQWTINTYNVTYVAGADGVENMPIDTTAEFASTFTLPTAAPTRKGYDFNGWTVTANGNAVIVTDNAFTMPAYDVTVTATWTIVTYTIEYILDGGTATNRTEYTVETETFTLNNPTKTGYTFTGWTETGVEGTSMEVVITTGSIGNREYIANWTVNTYTVTFNANGGMFGENATATSTVTYGETFANGTFNGWTTEPVRTGYTFVAWNTMANGEGTTVNATDTVGVLAEGYTLYAQWTINTYDVTYVAGADGVENMPMNTEAEFASTFTLPTAAPTRKGYDFNGWTVTANGNAVTVTDNAFEMPAYDVTVTATWTIVTYTIEYILNDGTATNLTEYTVETETFTLNNPTKTGYTFTGWTETGVEGTSMEVEIAQGSIGDREYTANWTANTYTVTFDANGGMFGENATETSTVTYGETFANGTLNAWTDIPTHEGWTLTGWSTAIVDGTTVNATDTVGELAEGYTLYAIWQVNSYNITFNAGTDDTVVGLPANTTQYYGLSYTLPAGPTRDFYTFAGWTVTANGEAVEVVSNAFTMPAANVTITATWQANTYNVTYQAGLTNVSGMPANGTCVFGENYTVTATVPTREGYTFSHWMSSENATEYTANMQFAMPSHDVVLTAVWDIHTHSVSFATGTTEAVANMPQGGNRDYGESFVIGSEIPTRTGYTFKNWTSSTGDEFNPGASFTMPDASVTLTANWTINSHNVVYSAGEGVTGVTVPATVAYNYGQSVTVSTDVPTRTGYTFVAWSVTGTFTMPDNDVTITAIWSINKHTVSYIANGSDVSGMPANTDYDYNTAVTVAAAPTRTGYTFVNWTISTDGSTVNPGASFTMPDNDVTLTANWTVNSHNVVYTAGVGVTGVTVPETVAYNYGDSVTVSTATPERRGYNFTGWTVAGATAANGVFTMPDNDVTITANWTIINYDISYVLNNGSVTGNPTTYNVESGEIRLINPTKNGYDFAGWTGDGTGTDVTIPAGSIGNRSYTANWTAINYAITYNLDGGTADNPTSYTIESSFTLVNPTKPGYDFAGWTGDGTGTNVSIAAGTTGEKTFTATWTVGVYTVVLDHVGGTPTSKTPNTIYFRYSEGFCLYGNDSDYVYNATSNIEPPTKAGFIFGGYYTEPNGAGTMLLEAFPVNNPYGVYATPETDPGVHPTVITSNCTLYAKWIGTPYYVTYAAGTTDAITVPVDSAAHYSGDSVTAAAAPTRTGYTFNGWSISSGGTVAAGGTFTMPAGNVILTATWQAASYSITYYAGNGITGVTVPAATSANYGATFNISADTPLRDGFTFTGWTASGSVTGNYGVNGSFVMGAGAVILTANWSEIGYDVIYYAGDGVTDAIIPANSSVAYGAQIVLGGASRTGYSFDGWLSSVDGLIHGENATITVTAPVTFTAQWSINSYSYTYNAGVAGTASNMPANGTRNYGATFTIPTTVPTANGYEFTNWTVAGSVTGTYQAGQTVTMGAGAVTLTANWTEVATAATLNFTDSINSMVLTVETEADLSTTSAVKTALESAYPGYTFVVSTRSGSGNTTTASGYRTMTVDSNTCKVITNAIGLEYVRNNLTGAYVLDSNIALTGTWTPIGTSSAKFSGKFYGGNGVTHTISGVNVSGVDYAGFFGVASATIENLIIQGSISGTSRVGGIVGEYQSATMRNCGLAAGSTVSSSSAQYVGGLAGYTTGQVRFYNCYNQGNVTNTKSSSASTANGALAAGIVAYFSGSNACRIENCYNSGNVTCTTTAAGILGSSSNGSESIKYCYNSGVIATTGTGGSGNSDIYTVAAGILGNVNAKAYTISYCYNTGLTWNPSGTTNGSSAGIWGSNSGGSTTNGPQVSYCYTVGYARSYYTGQIAVRNRTQGANSNSCWLVAYSAASNLATTAGTGSSSYTTISSFVSGWTSQLGSTYYQSTSNVPYWSSISGTSTANLPTFKSAYAAGIILSAGTNFTGGSVVAPTSYTVTYNTGSVSATMPANGSVLEGASYTISSTEPTASGYAFVNWTATGNKTGTYAAGATIANVTGDITLTANWTVYVAEDTLDKALNVSGGTLKFGTACWDATASQTNPTLTTKLPWVVDSTNHITGSNASAKAGNTGDAGRFTGSFIYSAVTVNANATISFNWKVVSESTYDYLRFYAVKGTTVPISQYTGSVTGSSDYQITGTVSWESKTYTFTSAGTYYIYFMYCKDTSGQVSGEGAWVDNVTLTGGTGLAVPTLVGGAATPTATPTLNTLDSALNADGSFLNFTNDSSQPWTVDTDNTFTGRTGVARSGAGGVSGGTSTLTLTVSMTAGDTLHFDIACSAESTSYDYVAFYVDGTINGDKVCTKDNNPNWESRSYTAISTKTYTFTWKFQKDGSADKYQDRAWVDNVRIVRVASSIHAPELDLPVTTPTPTPVPTPVPTPTQEYIPVELPRSSATPVIDRTINGKDYDLARRNSK